MNRGRCTRVFFFWKTSGRRAVEWRPEPGNSPRSSCTSVRRCCRMEGVGMGIEIAITVAREETRVAVLDGGVVTDLFGDRAKHKDFVGNIYKGKVAKVLPG